MILYKKGPLSEATPTKSDSRILPNLVFGRIRAKGEGILYSNVSCTLFVLIFTHFVCIFSRIYFRALHSVPRGGIKSPISGQIMVDFRPVEHGGEPPPYLGRSSHILTKPWIPVGDLLQNFRVSVLIFAQFRANRGSARKFVCTKGNTNKR